MRHSWMKMGGFDLVRDSDDEEGTVRHRVNQVKECRHCGLRKGSCSTMSFFPILMYYKNDVVESLETLPYACKDQEELEKEKKEKEFEESIFFTENEFYV